jgi:hypothetical protein
VVDEDRSCSLSAAVGSPIYVSSKPKSPSNGHELQCGTLSNPWIVEAQTGQQININLLHFGQQQQQQQQIGLQHQTDSGVNGQNVPVKTVASCTVQYGYIVDKAATAGGRNITVCDTGSVPQRDRFIYQSKGSTIEVVISRPQSGSNTTQPKFLLGFQGFLLFSIIFSGVFIIHACKLFVFFYKVCITFSLWYRSWRN